MDHKQGSRRIGAILVVIAIGPVLAGCGGDEQQSDTAPAKTKERSAKQLIGKGPWRYAGAGRDKRDIALLYELDGGACEVFRPTKVIETNDEVRITVLTDRGKATSCPDVGIKKHVGVRLRKPVGTRRLLDGSTGKLVEH